MIVRTNNEVFINKTIRNDVNFILKTINDKYCLLKISDESSDKTIVESKNEDSIKLMEFDRPEKKLNFTTLKEGYITVSTLTNSLANKGFGIFSDLNHLIFGTGETGRKNLGNLLDQIKKVKSREELINVIINSDSFVGKNFKNAIMPVLEEFGVKFSPDITHSIYNGV